MQVKLVGVQQINFTNTNGETISGINMYIAFKDTNVDGMKVEKVFVKPEIKLPDCKINDTIDISFNMRGKVEAVNKI